MKTLLVFILSLSLLVLGRPKHSHANADLYKLTYSSTAQNQQQLSSFRAVPKSYFIQNAHLNGKNELLSTLEDEEEDVVYCKKQLSDAKQFIAVAKHAPTFTNHDYFQQTRLTNYKQLSYYFSDKYIVHRALRI